MKKLPLIQSYLKKKNINVTDLVKDMGVARNTFYYQIEKETPDSDFIARFNKATGDDFFTITNSTDVDSVVKSQVNGVFLSELVENDDETPFLDLKNGQLIMYVPLIQERAYASYMRGFSDPEYIEEMPRHSLIVSKQHRGRYVAIVVEGDSMTDGTINSIPEGAIATGREIQKQHWRNKFHIHRYQDYIIHHKEGVIIKRIIKHDVENGIISCHSLNPNKEDYPDFDLNLDDCIEIFNIVNVSLTR